VIPLVGPSSILLALMASGMNGQNFAFIGYIPVKPTERVKAIKEIERRSGNEKQTQIFIEAPYRNMPLLNDLINTLNDQTRLCVACDLTLESEYIKTQLVAQWKKGIPDLNKRPAIFLVEGS
jgi:16S rRNA (cytidine1402-2'-O)-methyltransferase